VVHRDVKAQNAMREEGGRILLTDFGAGIEVSDERRRQTRISGTPLYIATELFRGEPATRQSDIYSVGVLLYRLVTASYPIEATSWPELSEKPARREAKLLGDQRPDLPESFIEVVEKATAWNPEDRYATAGEMERALAQGLGAVGAVAARTAGRRTRTTTFLG